MNPKKCDLCGRKNREDGGRLDRWASWFIIMPNNRTVSVCPRCREKPITSIYTRLITPLKKVTP